MTEKFTYQWSTDHPHYDNTETMQDYLDNHLPEGWDIEADYGNYALVMDGHGNSFEVCAFGDGGSFNHIVEGDKL